MAENIVCTICFDELDSAIGSSEQIKKAVVLACGHCFHHTCITTAHNVQLQTSGVGCRLTCPLCQQTHCTVTLGSHVTYPRLFLSTQPNRDDQCKCTHRHPAPLVDKAASIFRLVREMEIAGTSIPEAIRDFVVFSTKNKCFGEIEQCKAMGLLMAKGVRSRLDSVLEVLQCWKGQDGGRTQMATLTKQVHDSTAHLLSASDRLDALLAETKARRTAQADTEYSNRVINELRTGLTSKTALIASLQSRVNVAEGDANRRAMKVKELRARLAKTEQAITASTTREKELHDREAASIRRNAAVEKLNKLLLVSLKQTGFVCSLPGHGRAQEGSSPDSDSGPAIYLHRAGVDDVAADDHSSSGSASPASLLMGYRGPTLAPMQASVARFGSPTDSPFLPSYRPPSPLGQEVHTPSDTHAVTAYAPPSAPSSFECRYKAYDTPATFSFGLPPIGSGSNGRVVIGAQSETLASGGSAARSDASNLLDRLPSSDARADGFYTFTRNSNAETSETTALAQITAQPLPGPSRPHTIRPLRDTINQGSSSGTKARACASASGSRSSVVEHASRNVSIRLDRSRYLPLPRSRPAGPRYRAMLANASQSEDEAPEAWGVRHCRSSTTKRSFDDMDWTEVERPGMNKRVRWQDERGL